jgi:hypothetical protein
MYLVTKVVQTNGGKRIVKNGLSTADWPFVRFFELVCAVSASNWWPLGPHEQPPSSATKSFDGAVHGTDLSSHFIHQFLFRPSGRFSRRFRRVGRNGIPSAWPWRHTETSLAPNSELPDWSSAKSVYGARWTMETIPSHWTTNAFKTSP